MKKVIFFLMLAFIFIGFVMISLLKSGVSLQERRMIKWSAVQSAEEAGAVVARHTYPLLSENSDIYIQGSSSISELFKSSFEKTVSSEGLKIKVHTNHIPRGYNGLVLSLMDLGDEYDSSRCTKENKTECLKIKSLKGYNKKVRSSGQLWIQMWRTSEKKLILFIKK